MSSRESEKTKMIDGFNSASFIKSLMEYRDLLNEINKVTHGKDPVAVMAALMVLNKAAKVTMKKALGISTEAGASDNQRYEMMMRFAEAICDHEVEDAQMKIDNK